MNPDDLKFFADFVAQRMELGETEWFFSPGFLRRDYTQSSSVETAPVSMGKQSEKPDGCLTLGDVSLFPELSPTNEELSGHAFAERDSLEELYETFRGCLRCHLGQKRTKFVFGEGNPHADLMFIGEAPGADEDIQGRPFVGRAGQLLTKMIEAIKLRRKDVYICNILKCRPPGNRDPHEDEIECCEPILLRQIDIIKPTIMCAVGRISGQTLLRTTSPLNALRGKVHDYHGIKLIVTYHPAALLRNPLLKLAAWEDLKFLRREHDGMEL